MKQYDFKKEYDSNGNESVTISNQRRIKLDLIPRLLCVVLALIIWIYCVNITDADVITTFTVKLETVGDMPKDMQMYSTSNVSEVTITVRGTNRDINKYSASDYSATIDVSQINSVGWSTLKITTMKPEGSDNSTLSILSANIDTVSVYADVSADTSVPLEIKSGNIKLPINYELDCRFENDVKDIMITGPKTLIDQISRAEYLLEGEFNKSALISGFALNFYNQNGEMINSANSTGDVSANFISYDTSTMTVNVAVTALVPLKIKAEGSNANYIYSVDQITAKVVGDPDMLNSLSDYIIDVDKLGLGIGVHNIDIMAEDLGYPEGVQLKDKKITVTVRITEKPIATP